LKPPRPRNHISSGEEQSTGLECRKRSACEIEARYQSLLAHIPAVTYTATLDSFERKLHCGPHLEGFLGYSKTQWQSDPHRWRRLIHPEDRDRVFGALRRTVATGEPFFAEYRMITKDGPTVWFRDCAVFIRDMAGEQAVVHGTAFDITQQKQAEELLQIQRDLAIGLGSTSDPKKALEFLLMAVSRMGGIDCGGVYLVDVKTGELDLISHQGLSASFIERVSHYGADAPETRLAMVGEPFYCTHPGEILNTGGLFDREGLLSLAVIPVKFQGRVVAVLNLASHTHRDIPQSTRYALESIAAPISGIVGRIWAEDALREGEKLCRQFIETSLEGIWMLDADARTTFVNSRMTEMLGYAAEEMIGRSVWEFLDKEAGKEVIKHFAARRRQGSERYDLKLRKKDHSSLWVIVSSRSVFDDSGQFMGSFGMLVDVTERRRVEEALRKSEQRLHLLSSKLLCSQEEERKRLACELHDSIGSTLVATKISIENARNQLQEMTIGTECLDTCIAWAQHALDEARRLMSDLRPQILDDLGLVPAMDWLLRQFRETYPAIRLESRVNLGENEVDDRLHIVIFRVLQEALNNIAKHSQATSVDVLLSATTSALELLVEDNGVGCGTDITVSDKYSSGGLGLMSMKERVELTGGSFSLKSTCGGGTLIKVCWGKDAMVYRR
jgi:PAS domain S-box-containing protein